MTTADIRDALQRDRAAASGPPSSWARVEARARLAAIPGPKLLAALMALLADERISCDDCPSCLDSAAHQAVAESARALGL